jgi:hypothetical protein
MKCLNEVGDDCDAAVETKDREGIEKKAEK